MKKNREVMILFILCSCFILNAAHPLININSKQYWLNGINMPWNSFGSDFGTHYQWGALHDSALFDESFKKYSDNGINAVRVWVHCDGRTSPEFSAPGGAVTGLDANFFDDFDNMMALAEKYSIFVMPVLWSFDMSKINTGSGQYAGVNTPLIADSMKTISYINNALIPLVKHCANHPALFAWEICNEPEWIVETLSACQIKELQRFHAMLAAAIHENCGNYVTTGAASLKWNSSHSDCEGNWWSDSALQSTHNNTEAFLDIYQIHFYEWMIPWYVPYTKGVDYWQDIGDRPVIIGETPGKDVTHAQFTMPLTDMYEAAYNKEYAGVFAWSDRADPTHGTFDNIQVATNAFYTNHPDIVDGLTTPTFNFNNNNPKNNTFAFSHFTRNGIIILTAHKGFSEYGEISVTLYNAKGERIIQVNPVFHKQQNCLIIDDALQTNLSNGIYFFHITTGSNESVFKVPITVH